MPSGRPVVVALAGPNGAGKSTAGPALLRDLLDIREFVNADVIARGLSAFDPERAALSAGRAMIARVRDLATRRASFAFETTLAGRGYAPWISRLVSEGYDFNIVFIWLPSVDMALARVANRVKLGGHDVPPEVVRRRYASGLRNFFRLYRPLASSWRFYDGSAGRLPRLTATGGRRQTERVVDRVAWERISREGK
jgi:predicted ABC-type ATPase